MYIDTEGTFRPERLLAVAERSVLAALAEERGAITHGLSSLFSQDRCVNQPVALNSRDCCSNNCP